MRLKYLDYKLTWAHCLFYVYNEPVCALLKLISNAQSISFYAKVIFNVLDPLNAQDQLIVTIFYCDMYYLAKRLRCF